VTWDDLETLDFLGVRASVDQLGKTDFLEQQVLLELRETTELLVVPVEMVLLDAQERRETLRP